MYIYIFMIEYLLKLILKKKLIVMLNIYNHNFGLKIIHSSYKLRNYETYYQI